MPTVPAWHSGFIPVASIRDEIRSARMLIIRFITSGKRQMLTGLDFLTRVRARALARTVTMG